MNSVAIHRVTSLIIKEPINILGQNAVFWTRKIYVTDIDGHRTEITLFADKEELLEIKELT
jgi:hypothetical protein